MNHLSTTLRSVYPGSVQTKEKLLIKARRLVDFDVTPAMRADRG